MRKFVLVAVLGAAWLIPASVTAAHHAPYNIKPKHPKPYPISCTTENEGYYATGSLISASLTPVSHHRYSGTISVTVLRTNHRAPSAAQTYTLSNARVYFHHGVNRTAPAAGSRVQLTGKITELRKHCTMAGFTPTITIHKVDIRRQRR